MGPCKQFAEGVADTHKARAGSGAIEDYIEPVAVSKGTGPRPLVVAQFDAAIATASLNLDSQLMCRVVLRLRPT